MGQRPGSVITKSIRGTCCALIMLMAAKASLVVAVAALFAATFVRSDDANGADAWRERGERPSSQSSFLDVQSVSPLKMGGCAMSSSDVLGANMKSFKYSRPVECRKMETRTEKRGWIGRHVDFYEYVSFRLAETTSKPIALSRCENDDHCQFVWCTSEDGEVHKQNCRSCKGKFEAHFTVGPPGLDKVYRKTCD